MEVVSANNNHHKSLGPIYRKTRDWFSIFFHVNNSGGAEDVPDSPNKLVPNAFFGHAIFV